MATVLDDGLVLTWVSDPGPGMRVPGGAGTRIVTFISDIWSGAPTRLQQGAAAQYQKLARSGDFGPWWLNACGGEQPGVRRFRVQMPSTEWERPWEAIVAALDPSRWGDVSIIRQIEGDEAPRHPSSLSEALSVLVLQGAPSENFICGAGFSSSEASPIRSLVQRPCSTQPARTVA